MGSRIGNELFSTRHRGNEGSAEADLPTMSRRWVMVVVVGLVLAATAGATFLLTRNEDGAAQAPVAGTAPAPRLTAQEAESLAVRVTSGEVGAVRSAVTVSPGQELDAAAIDGLASLKPLTFDLASMRDAGESTVEISAQGSGGSRWMVRLLLVDGEWKISTTEPVR
ncbi:hypothetical protein [Amycolatopsis magusensis]|uniref:hypothetical protein n=1 Tax=Amycolatopsis magusensis TaxID=882444 RepID=UPI0024A998C8|nr:hypothetical protein [Amycolatopsis magusensis]MDI5978223.1 hypothetical protein [Amycolatopsis magusensis]